MNRSIVLFLALALLAPATQGCDLFGGGETHGPTVGRAELVRGGASVGNDRARRAIAAPVRVERGMRVSTEADARAILRLDRGAVVLLDRDTVVKPDLASLVLEKGRIFVDATDADATTIETPNGSLVAEGATLSVRLAGGRVEAYCASGEVTYRSPRGSDRFAQGETLVLGPGAPKVEPAEVFDDWTGGLADPTPRRTPSVSHVGILAARGFSALGEAYEPLAIRGHEVTATIRGDLAVTTVEQTFFNGASENVVGEYAVRLPEHAIVDGFEVDTGSGYVPSSVVPVQNQVYQPVFLDDVSVPTSRLVYDGPGRVRARIQPIAPGAVVRVRLRYTEWLVRRGAMRSYALPMRAEGEAPLVGELAIHVDAKDSGAKTMRAGMGATIRGTTVELRQSDARPRADFVVDLFDDDSPTKVAAYESRRPRATGEGEDVFVLFDVPTDGLFDADEATKAKDPLDLVLVVDTSGGTEPEDLELARSVVESVLRHLSPTDRVTLRFSDVASRTPEGVAAAPTTASTAVRDTLLEAVARMDVAGATDLATSLRSAASVVAGKPRGVLLYLGDGVPTTGAMSATAIRAALDSVEAPPRLFALGLGEDANVDLLRAVFGEATSVVGDRTEATGRVLRFLADAARPTLRGVTVALGPTVERVFPRGTLVVPEGEPLRLVARLQGELPQRVRIRGLRDGRAVEKTLEVESARLDDGGDIPRRWGSRRLDELLDDDEGREAIAELGLRFALLTPWTMRVVGGTPSVPVPLLRGFDVDPNEPAWDVGGRGPGLRRDELGAPLGWRARAESGPFVATAPETTWESHPVDVLAAAGGTGDGGLALAAVRRVLALGGRGPSGCYERRLATRPDLQGRVTVDVQVDGNGRVLSVMLVSSTLGVDDVDACILDEVRGLGFPATLGATVRVTHVFEFFVPTRQLGITRHCSSASQRDLATRKRLWRERLDAYGGSTDGAIEVFRDAERRCELPDWGARRALATMILGFVREMPRKIEIYRAFVNDPVVSAYLKRAILRAVRTPEDVILVRNGLGLDAGVEWSVFARMWNQATTPDAKLALVRRWLEVVPDDFDLRLRFLRLLEETRKLPEARRVAASLREDPLADARVRTRVAEFWLRQGRPDEARRAVSELVERTPLDPWARRRLGDVYLAHGLADDAYREYETLARLVPDEPAVLLLLARAAEAAGRTDEALRLEQRLSEQSDADVDEGAAAYARFHTSVQLARMKVAARDASLRAAIHARERATGALRDPPDAWVALVFRHPDDALVLRYATPTMTATEPMLSAEVEGPSFGIDAFRIREREDGTYRIRIERPDTEDLRESVAELVVVERPGRPDERITTRELRLTRDQRVKELALGASGLAP
ncbi:MAG: AgmX/PglI C-terminal domain-containing protein [Polyangiales bacterium]